MMLSKAMDSRDNYGCWEAHYRYMASQCRSLEEWDSFYKEACATLTKYQLSSNWNDDPRINKWLDLRLTALKSINTEEQLRRRP